MTLRRYLAAACVLVRLLGPELATAADPTGSVTAVEGQAETMRAGGAEWTPLATGAPVFVGDQLRTSPDGKVKLLFNDESVLTLGPGSNLTITEQVAGAAAPVSRFGLLLGTVRAVVTERYQAPGARFELETPTAVAGVHGTGFIATYDGAADESVFVGLFDTTIVRSRAERDAAHRVRLGPGQITRVGRGRLPVAPSRAPEAVLRGLNGATTIVPRLGGQAQKSAPGKQGPGAGGRRAGDTTVAPESTVDQPVELLKGGKRRPPPPPPPVR
jgi:hypothetical protein